MKKAMMFLSFALAFVCGAAIAAEADGTINILTVGNSFSNDASTYLNEMFKAGGKKFKVDRSASLGGHSFGQHLKYFEACEADPQDAKGRPYGNKTKTLQDILKSKKWDYITIQQVSHLSFKPETFADGEKLAAAIRKYAPDAKILIHETWSYRQDSGFYKQQKFTEREMYERLHKNYNELAAKIGAGVLPSGTAFQAALNSPEWGFKLDPKDKKELKDDELPADIHSLHVGYKINTDKKTGEKKRGADFNHASVFGRFLGGAVWYEYFCGDIEKNSFVPKGMTADEAKVLRKIAAETVKNQQKNK